MHILVSYCHLLISWTVWHHWLNRVTSLCPLVQDKQNACSKTVTRNCKTLNRNVLGLHLTIIFLIILLAVSPIHFNAGSPFSQWQCVTYSARKKEHSRLSHKIWSRLIFWGNKAQCDIALAWIKLRSFKFHFHFDSVLSPSLKCCSDLPYPGCLLFEHGCSTAYTLCVPALVLRNLTYLHNRLCQRVAPAL